MSEKTAKSLPVLMHHYISRYPNSIAVTPELFEDQCRSMAEQGWRGVSLAEAEDFMLGRGSLPAKSCLITFDDGYLDNYVNAWPILKKYGHQGVIFAVAERIERSGPLRPTLDDLWSGRLAQSELPDVDRPMRKGPGGLEYRRDRFFNWAEARHMEESGVIAIAAHSLRHESIMDGPAYEKVLEPAEEKRTFIHTSPPSCWGMPFFKRKPELSGQAFLPAPELVEAVRKLVPQDDEAALDFFKDSGKREALAALLSGFAGRGTGRLESEKEMRERIYALMRKNQEILTNELGHPVKSFCWPWGIGSVTALQTGMIAGFQVFFSCDYGPNKPGSQYNVRRFKVKNKPGKWLLGRLRIYGSPLLGALYARMRI